uniref:Signal recognition particle 19 kDa protein n=1 Tax=Romanomermis culicivorax TaxID=13658 RepID=A0A915L711_ROMCU
FKVGIQRTPLGNIENCLAPRAQFHSIRTKKDFSNKDVLVDPCTQGFSLHDANETKFLDHGANEIRAVRIEILDYFADQKYHDHVYVAVKMASKKLPSDESRWICVYPAYINIKKSKAEGRRIPKNVAVENPTSQEMLDVCKSASLNVILERKMYPRDPSRDYQFQGRIRIQLKNDKGELLNDLFPSNCKLKKMLDEPDPALRPKLECHMGREHSIMLYVAEMIPKLKSRQLKSGIAPTNNQPETSAANKKKKR